MIDWAVLPLYIFSSILLILAPGPDSIYVVSNGISGGKQAGIVSAAGITLGVFVHTLFAALGVAVFLMTSALLFTVVKIAGVAYLVCLGVKSILSKNDLLPETELFFTGRKKRNLSCITRNNCLSFKSLF